MPAPYRRNYQPAPPAIVITGAAPRVAYPAAAPAEDLADDLDDDLADDRDDDRGSPPAARGDTRRPDPAPAPLPPPPPGILAAPRRTGRRADPTNPATLALAVLRRTGLALTTAELLAIIGPGLASRTSLSSRLNQYRRQGVIAVRHDDDGRTRYTADPTPL
jgi:hypothetical protein